MKQTVTIVKKFIKSLDSKKILFSLGKMLLISSVITYLMAISAIYGASYNESAVSISLLDATKTCFSTYLLGFTRIVKFLFVLLLIIDVLVNCLKFIALGKKFKYAK